MEGSARPRPKRLRLGGGLTGHGPMGLHLGPYSGKVAADAITGDGWPTETMAFGVERFL